MPLNTLGSLSAEQKQKNKTKKNENLFLLSFGPKPLLVPTLFSFSLRPKLAPSSLFAPARQAAFGSAAAQLSPTAAPTPPLSH